MQKSRKENYQIRSALELITGQSHEEIHGQSILGLQFTSWEGRKKILCPLHNFLKPSKINPNPSTASRLWCSRRCTEGPFKQPTATMRIGMAAEYEPLPAGGRPFQVLSGCDEATATATTSMGRSWWYQARFTTLPSTTSCSSLLATWTSRAMCKSLLWWTASREGRADVQLRNILSYGCNNGDNVNETLWL